MSRIPCIQNKKGELSSLEYSQPQQKAVVQLSRELAYSTDLEKF